MEWQPKKVLLVGGPADVRKQLEEKLKKAVGPAAPEFLDHWEEGRNAGVLPRAAQAVLVLTDFTGHSQEASVKTAALKAGIPVVLINRKWAHTYPRLRAAGLVPVPTTPEAIPAPQADLELPGQTPVEVPLAAQQQTEEGAELPEGVRDAVRLLLGQMEESGVRGLTLSASLNAEGKAEVELDFEVVVIKRGKVKL